MSDYASNDPFRHFTHVPSDDNSDEGGEGSNSSEDPDESGDGNTHPTSHTPPGRPTPNEAGLTAANADFNCHDEPSSEIACIKNQIRRIQNWSETVNDTKLMGDMLTRLKEISEFLDFLMEGTKEENEVDDNFMKKMIIKAREEVVGIGLKAKKMEVVQKNEGLDPRVLEAMVKTFVGRMAEEPMLSDDF